MALVYNVFFSIILIAGAIFVWIITDDGGIQSFIQDIHSQGFQLSLLAFYMVFAHVSSASMALNKAIIDVDEEEQEIKDKITESEKLDKELNDIRKVHLFLDDFNKARFDREQKNANQIALKRLNLKLYKKDSQTMLDKINEKLKNKKTFILKVRRLFYLHQKKIQDTISQIESGKLNAKVKKFKDIKAKELATYNTQKHKDADNPKLALTIRKRTYSRAFATSMTVNLISSFGVFIALQSIFKYSNWCALVIFLIFFIFLILFKYLLEYVRGRKGYKAEMLDVLREKIDIKTKCAKFIEKQGKIEPKEKLDQIAEIKQEINTNPPQLADT